MEFQGWNIPELFSTIKAEYTSVREHVTLFDFSHYGKIKVEGEDSTPLLTSLFTINVDEIPVGKSSWGALCNERGGIIDFVNILKTENYYLILTSPGFETAIATWIRRNTGNKKILLDDCTYTHCLISLQGLKTIEMVKQVISEDFIIPDINAATFGLIHGINTMLWRRNLSGNEGFLFYVGSLHASTIWNFLEEHGRDFNLTLGGYATFNIVRLEAGFPLNGIDYDVFHTPVEVGIEKYVDYKKSSFMGKKAIQHSTTSEFSKRLVCFEIEEPLTPRSKSPIFFGNQQVGIVTSGCLAPQLNKGIGMGMVDAICSRPKSELRILSTSDKNCQAKVFVPPFAGLAIF